MLAIALLILGGLLMAGGTALVSLPAGIIVAGMLVLAAGIDLARPGGR